MTHKIIYIYILVLFGNLNTYSQNLTKNSESKLQLDSTVYDLSFLNMEIKVQEDLFKTRKNHYQTCSDLYLSKDSSIIQMSYYYDSTLACEKMSKDIITEYYIFKDSIQLSKSISLLLYKITTGEFIYKVVLKFKANNKKLMFDCEMKDLLITLKAVSYFDEKINNTE